MAQKPTERYGLMPEQPQEKIEALADIITFLLSVGDTDEDGEILPGD